MADYNEEMSFPPLAEGSSDDRLLQFARLLYDLVHNSDSPTGEWPRLPPPAAKKAVEELKKDTVVCDSMKCPVCLKEYKIGEVVTVMPCEHAFHQDCINTWLEKTNSCPMCRFELPTDDPRYEEFKKEQKRAKEREVDIDNLHHSMFS